MAVVNVTFPSIRSFPRPRRRPLGHAAAPLWQPTLFERLAERWEVWREDRRVAALEARLVEFDDHVLKDIGASDELRRDARLFRQRQADPFAAGTTRGIEMLMRRSGW